MILATFTHQIIYSKLCHVVSAGAASESLNGKNCPDFELFSNFRVLLNIMAVL